jgi:hypothetical protein
MLDLKIMNGGLGWQAKGRIIVRLDNSQAEPVSPIRHFDSTHGHSPSSGTSASVSFFQNAHNIDAKSGTWNTITNQYNNVSYPIVMVASETSVDVTGPFKTPCEFSFLISPTTYLLL